jgi:hypothetical protein
MIMEVENMVSLYLQISGDQDHSGGYFCLMKEESGQILYVQKICDIPDVIDPDFDRKAFKYCYFAIEKAVRLFQSIDVRSSWMNRNPDKDQWGGAIRVHVEGSGLILSFSGLPELADEAIVLSAAVRRGLMSYKDAAEIAELSNNEFFFNMNPTAKGI